MQERCYESGSCVQKNCASLGVHPKGRSPTSAIVPPAPSENTYGIAKLFRCNTYKKQGGYILQAKSLSLFRSSFRPLLTSLPLYVLTSRAALGVGGCWASGRRWRGS